MSGVWTPSHQHQEDDGSAERPLRVQLSSQRQDGRSLCYNGTTVAYFRQLGGTWSQVLFLKAREILLLVESLEITLILQLIQGSLNTRADLLSWPNLVIGSEWTLHQVVGQDLLHLWPAIIDLFATSLTARLCVLYSSVRTQSSGGRCIPPALGQPSGICLSSHSYHKESSSQTESLSQLRSDSNRPFLASKGMVSRSAGTSIRHSNKTTQTSRSAATTAFPSVSRKSSYASSDCVATQAIRQSSRLFCDSGWPTCPL